MIRGMEVLGKGEVEVVFVRLWSQYKRKGQPTCPRDPRQSGLGKSEL